MKASNAEVVTTVEKCRGESRVGQLRREKLIAAKPDERKEPGNNQIEHSTQATSK